ncbi:MAG: ribonuclease J, partial [Oscillospiraceae bacterium]
MQNMGEGSLDLQPSQKKPSRRRSGRAKQDIAPLRIVSLGGLGEIGKNMTVIEYQNDIVIVDCGLAFPDDDMPGIDLVIPDFSYVIKNRDRVRGVVLTHGHEDHIGSLGYLLKEIDVPVYSCRLTIGLVEGKLRELGVLGRAHLNVVKAGDTVKLGCMSVEFIAVNHSIPDACGLAIFTPVGTIVHTGDFKIDYTPVDGVMINLARFGELGRHGVLALLSDSTNAERPGITPSERRVGESFETLFRKAGDRRIIVASFSSNVHRIQQVIDIASRCGRKVVVSGRSMENVTAKAIELGYLKVPPNTLVEIDKMRAIPDGQLVIITTGSQGEPMSALTRMARGDHRKITVTGFDFIIISATPIPGNEKLVGKVINDLMRLGAEVIYESTMGIHVSGHASREDIRAIIGLTKPKFFMPVHGEYKHLVKNRELAIDMGIPPDNIMVSEIGRVVELTPESIRSVNTVPTGAIMVDGSGVGDVGSIVLRDRKLLAEDGLIIAVATIDSKTGAVVAGPDVVSRGFVYVREAEELLAGARQVCRQALASAAEGPGG